MSPDTRTELASFIEKGSRGLTEVLDVGLCGERTTMLQNYVSPIETLRRKLMPPAYVKPYVKRGKTDAADARLSPGRACASSP
jgi:hypothetical protein